FWCNHNDHKYKVIPYIYVEIHDYIDRILSTGDLPSGESFSSRYTRPIPVMVKGFNEDQDALSTLVYLSTINNIRFENIVHGVEYLGIESWAKITCTDVVILTAFSLYPMMDMTHINKVMRSILLSDGDLGDDVKRLKSDYDDVIASIKDIAISTWDI